MKDFLKKAFPFITTAAATVGGPVGGAAAAALGKALGLDKADASNPPSLDELAAAYTTSTPEQRLAAQKEEHDFQARMAEMNIKNVEDLEQIAAADRADARSMTIKTGDVWTPRLLAAVVVIGWIAVQFYVIPHAMQAQAKDQMTLGRVLGTLDSALTLVLAFYFGSSASSRIKDEALAQSVQK